MTSGKSINDLLTAMTRDEKLAMLHQHSPPIDRLGLGRFHTGCEALHGVAWLGEATVFPQPVGLAATWDPELLRRIGEAASIEVRAKRAADPSVSLNVWAPVVNTLRHPLWGRNEEGYSEDPDLTAELGAAYSRGLRGEDPHVWRTVPTLKHFLAYNNETDRSVTSSHLPPQTLREFELPAHFHAVASGWVGSVMPSYNLVNGRPAHLCSELMDELRDAAAVELAICSDAAAPSFMVDLQRFYATHAQSHAAALAAGVDSYTDHDSDAKPTIQAFTEALDQGLISESDVDRAVRRVLLVRERSGEFTPETDPYRGISPTDIDTPDHRDLAREAAGRGVVVLENRESAGARALPLVSPEATTPASIAVIGAFADHLVHDWYSGTPPYHVTLATALRERFPDAQIRVADGSDRVALRSVDADRYVEVAGAEAKLSAAAVAATPAAQFDVTDWGNGTVTLRSVSTGKLLSGSDWIVSASAGRVGGWVAQETFRLVTGADGTSTLQHVGSGKWVRILDNGLLAVEADRESAARFVLRVLRSGAAAAADACVGAERVIVAVGNDPHIDGRETQDRPDLELPQRSRELWNTAVESGAAPVLVIVSSYPYNIAPLVPDASAVVWSCHAGQELGHGLVDVLAGDREPEGRLAQTWWERPEDAGDLLDYDVVTSGATYRYSSAAPLYPLGRGLTYSEVDYESIELDRPRLTAPEPTTTHVPARSSPDDDAGSRTVDHEATTAAVTVRNTGDRPAHELVAVWVRAPRLTVRAPEIRLAGYRRVQLAPGERRTVTVPVHAGLLAVWDVAADPVDSRTGQAPVSTRGAFVVQAGTYRVVSGPDAGTPVVTSNVTIDGPQPGVRRPDILEAAAAHAFESVVTGALSRVAGGCLDVQPHRQRGWARFDRVQLHGRSRITAVLARSGHGRSAATIRVRPSGTDQAWTEIAHLQLPSADPDPYEWHDAGADLTHGNLPAAATLDLQVELIAGTRLAALRFD